MISIHSLRVEGDSGFTLVPNPEEAFQSTPSVWRETQMRMQKHVVRGFQSTPSVWRETSRHLSCLTYPTISIHSLRVEGDYNGAFEMLRNRHFNPLPPCGGRQYSAIASRLCPSFQSTPSVWRETAAVLLAGVDYGISIHSLRVEGDIIAHIGKRVKWKFQSTPSVWRETKALHTCVGSVSRFQSTPSVWRETTFF